MPAIYRSLASLSIGMFCHSRNSSQNGRKNTQQTGNPLAISSVSWHCAMQVPTHRKRLARESDETCQQMEFPGIVVTAQVPEISGISLAIAARCPQVFGSNPKSESFGKDFMLHDFGNRVALALSRSPVALERYSPVIRFYSLHRWVLVGVNHFVILVLRPSGLTPLKP